MMVVMVMMMPQHAPKGPRNQVMVMVVVILRDLRSFGRRYFGKPCIVRL